jgi:sporulation protein YlmC with PRC-barrel domain
MAIEKRPSTQIVGKRVVTKEGKNIGVVNDITFETRTGELIQLMVGSKTAHAQALNLETSNEGHLLVPYSAILAIGDFVVVSEEDMK